MYIFINIIMKLATEELVQIGNEIKLIKDIQN